MSEKKNRWRRNDLRRLLSLPYQVLKGVALPDLRGLTLRSFDWKQTGFEGPWENPRNPRAVCFYCRGKKRFDDQEWARRNKFGDKGRRTCFVCTGTGFNRLPHPDVYLGLCAAWVAMMIQDGRVDVIRRVAESELDYIVSLDRDQNLWIQRAGLYEFWSTIHAGLGGNLSLIFKGAPEAVKRGVRGFQTYYEKLCPNVWADGLLCELLMNWSAIPVHFEM